MLRLKVVESNLLKYGVENTTSLPEVKAKVRATNLARYGVEYTMLNKEIQQKRNNTNLKKYGSISPLGNKDVIQKSKETLLENYGVTNPTLNKEILSKSMETLTNHGLQKVSKQQQYFYDIIGGELNYPVGYYALDIALTDEKIDIEYNGGGHNLQVKLGQIDENKFIQKETWRKKYLYSYGWKIITLISPSNKTLDKDSIISLINAAKQYFIVENRHWVEIFIEEKKIHTSILDMNFEEFIYNYSSERLNEKTP